MPLGVYLMFGFVALFVVFMGIKMVMDNRAETARIEAKKKADAEAEAAYQKLLADTQAADLKRMQEIMAGTSPNQEPRPGAFRGIDKTSVPPPIRSTYERYGEYNIPPAGTVYEHRNGQMHQVR